MTPTNWSRNQNNEHDGLTHALRPVSRGSCRKPFFLSSKQNMSNWLWVLILPFFLNNWSVDFSNTINIIPSPYVMNSEIFCSSLAWPCLPKPCHVLPLLLSPLLFPSLVSPPSSFPTLPSHYIPPHFILSHIRLYWHYDVHTRNGFCNSVDSKCNNETLRNL